MINKTTIKEYYNLFKKLPSHTQKAILSPDTAEIIGNMLDKYPEVLDDILPGLVGDIIMGISSLETAKKTLEDVVGKEIAEDICDNIENQIITPFKTQKEVKSNNKKSSDSYREIVE